MIFRNLLLDESSMGWGWGRYGVGVWTKTAFHMFGKLGSKQVHPTGGRLTRDPRAHRSYCHRLTPTHLHVTYI
jgi:hypothetical protein